MRTSTFWTRAVATLLLLLAIPAFYVGPAVAVAYSAAIIGVTLWAVSERDLSLPLGLQANTITNLIPTIHAALDIVVRELVGYIPAVSQDFRAENVGINQNVNSPVAPVVTTSNIVPGQTPPDDGDQTFDNVQVTITKSKYAPVRWSGEEQIIVNQTGVYGPLVVDQFAQAFRALVNEIEVDLGTAAYQGASRAYGTPGTAPFGTAGNMDDLAQPYKILDDNGMPKPGRQVVLGTTAMANIRGKQSNLFKVNEAGTADLLRQGILGGPLLGWSVRDSAGVQTPTKGTGSAYTTTAAGFAVGTTSIPLITGSGTILAGDVVTFAGDTNKYVVGTGISAPGTIVLNKPGLRVAIPAAATAVTVGNTAAQNSAFVRSAIVLATRLPAMPKEGDMAADMSTITDPISGLTFQLALYKLYRRIRYEIGLSWGFKVVKSEGVANLLG